MTQSPPLVCVVTPVHNTAKHLADCIESVLAQDYTNWIYVILDNCSSDGSREIAERFAKCDSRIRVVDNDRLLPQIANYNRALRLAADGSEFCKVVQADDRIMPGCLSAMVAVAQSSPNIGLVSSYRLVGDRVTGDGLPIGRSVFNGREVCRRQFLDDDFFFGSPTTVMYRSSLVRAREDFYDPEALHEDTEACYRILQSHDFGFVHQVLSFSRVADDSISGRVRAFHPHLLDKMIIVNKYGPAFLSSSEYEQCRRQIERRYFRALARSALSRRPRDFWAYHSRGLATIRRRILSVSLLKGYAWVIVDIALNPKKTLSELISMLKRRRSTAR